MSRPVTFATLLPLILVLGGCDLKVAHHEIQLRHEPSDDSLDALLVYRGVAAAQETEESVAKALEIANRILSGRREGDLFGHFDLDEIAADPELDPETASVLDRISLEEVRPFIDEEGRLACYQRFRVSGLAGALACLNRHISSAVLESAAEEEAQGRPPAPEWDERTRTLWLERARGGHQWISFQDGLFVLDLPVTAETADRVQRELIDEVLGSGDPGFAAGLLAHLHHLSHADERLTLTFGAPVTGVFRLASRDRGVVYHPGLHEALAAQGASIEELEGPPGL